tara:strand:+ start:638 stop:841 length:204 start_codon:yes stop_codon:yes gene_type:complete
MKLRIGDKVEWRVGVLNSVRVIGVVMDEDDFGIVTVVSHSVSRNRNYITKVNRKKLKRLKNEIKNWR